MLVPADGSGWNMKRVAQSRTWFALSLLWITAAGYLGWSRWPQLPLDSSPNDPATLDLYAAVSLNHAVFYTLLAMLGPMVLLVILKMLQKSSPDEAAKD
jgi:hypothetical protein